jgi:hypothetical protein
MLFAAGKSFLVAPKMISSVVKLFSEAEKTFVVRHKIFSTNPKIFLVFPKIFGKQDQQLDATRLPAIPDFKDLFGRKRSLLCCKSDLQMQPDRFRRPQCDLCPGRWTDWAFARTLFPLTVMFSTTDASFEEASHMI